MNTPFSKYVQIKDKVCIGYFGYTEEYIVQLRALRPNMESSFPGVNIYLACREEFLGRLKGEPMTMSLGDLKSSRKEFGMVYEVLRGNRCHPIEEFMEASGIPCEVRIPRVERTSKCLIFPSGGTPADSMRDDQVQKAMAFARANGYRPEFGEDLTGVGLVVGVESPQFYEAAFSGIEAKLVTTGKETKFFEKMFPGYGVLKI